MSFRKHVLVILRGERRNDYEQMYMLEYTHVHVHK